MSGEVRIVRPALAWGATAATAGAVLAYLVRDAAGAISVALAAGIVLTNAALAAGFSALAGRISTATAALISLPSFTVRMALIFAALALLKGQAFIDHATFAATFGIAVTVVLYLESRTWRRTPWIALTMEEKS